MAKKKAKKKMMQKTPNAQVQYHSFEVGKEYQNRDGTYQVVSIDEPDMVIRYLNGLVIESTIVLQARIWENIQEGQ